jgi:hypothetical protein
MAIKPPNINDPKTWVKFGLGLTPAGRVYNLADVAVGVATGKSLTDRITSSVTKPTSSTKAPTTKTTTTTNTNNNKKKKKEAVGVSYDPAQLGKKDMRVGRLSRGGMVSHKSIYDLEK